MDCREVVDRARTLVSQGVEPSERALSDWSMEYAEAVGVVNRRVSQCVELLRAGRRSEAIHLAEIKPAVLELAGVLDFPERAALSDRCAQAGLGLAQLDEQGIVEIDEAYTDEARVGKTLRSHRLLALARAPLRDRIAVLRRLTQVDPLNPLWGEDLETFERARFEQIRVESSRAHSAGDLKTLEALCSEVQSPWLSAPPTPLLQGVKAARDGLWRAWAAGELVALAGALDVAVGSEDAGEVDRLLKKWDAIQADSAGLPELPQGVESARSRGQAMLTAQRVARAEAKAYTAALAQLEHELDQRRDVEAVRRAWVLVERYERPIPEPFRRRYESLISQKAMIDRRRFRLMFTALVGGVLLAGAATAYALRASSQARELQRWTSQIKTAVDDASWSQAEELLVSLAGQRPDLLAGSAELQSMRGRVLEELDRQRRQGEGFEAALASAEAALTSAESSGVALQDLSWLRSARAQAGSPDQLAKVERVEARHKLHQARLLAESDRTLHQELKMLRGRFEAMEPALRSEPTGPAAQALLAELQSLESAAGLLAMRRSVSDAALSAAGTFASALAQSRQGLEKTILREQESARRIDHLLSLFDKPEQLAEGLLAFRHDFPGHPLNEEFLHASRQLPAWVELTAWGEAVGGVSLDWSADPQAADRALQSMQELQRRFAQGVFSSPAQALMNYMNRLQIALDEEASPWSPSGDLQKILRGPLLSRVSEIPRRGGNSIFVDGSMKPGGPDVIGDRYSINYVSDAGSWAGPLRSSPGLFEKTHFVSPLQARRPAFGVFASAALERVRQAGKPDWRDLHRGLLMELLADGSIDPLVRVGLGGELARLAIHRDAYALPSLEAWRRAVESFSPDLTWLDPTADLRERRGSAERLLALAPTAEALELEAGIMEREAMLLGLSRRPIGLMMRRPGEASKGLVVGTDTLGPGRLEAVVMGPNEPELVVIGEDGVLLASAAGVPSGSMVFHSHPRKER